MSEITTSNAPGAIGPYAQARQHGNVLYVSGQLPVEAKSGEIVASDGPAQVAQCLRNIEEIAHAAGTSLSNCLKTTILVTDLSQFERINDVYAAFFSAPYPARATFEVSALPKGAMVEVEAVIGIP